jgi:hypothetical protein
LDWRLVVVITWTLPHVLATSLENSSERKKGHRNLGSLFPTSPEEVSVVIRTLNNSSKLFL